MYSASADLNDKAYLAQLSGTSGHRRGQTTTVNECESDSHDCDYA